MESILFFSGLLSAASMSFIVTIESNLSPNPSDTTNALLVQLVQIRLGNFTAAGSTPADPVSTWSPSASTVRIQMVAYASLSMSLLAACGVILSKESLWYYKSHRNGHGSLEEQGKRRQEMFNGLVTWYFDAVVQFIRILLQTSLLPFGIALGANMWYQQPSIALVIIFTTVFGFLFYSLTVMACLISPSCPFQTPMSMILCILSTDRVLCPVFKRVFGYFQQLKTSAHGVLLGILGTLRPSYTRFYEGLAGHVYAAGAFARRSLQLSFAVLRNWLRSCIPCSSTKVGDSETPLDQDLDVMVKEKYILTFDLRDIPTSDLEARSIKWLLEISTDSEVFLPVASLVPQVEWPLDLDVSDTLHQPSNIFASCVDIQGIIVPSLEEKASACTTALTHLYYARVLQAYPRYDDVIARERADTDVFWEIFRGCICAREEIASIDAIDDARLREIVLTILSPAIMSVVCLHPSPIPANDGPDRFFDYHRDLCYLETIFTLARNSIWHPHLSEDRHIDRCISMIPKYCNSEDYSQHAFCIAGILLRIAHEQTSDTSLDSVTEQQWWDVMRCAWFYLPYIIRETHDSELLVFVNAQRSICRSLQI